MGARASRAPRRPTSSRPRGSPSSAARAPLVLALRSVGALPPEERGPTGQRLNAARRELEALADERREALERAALEARLAATASTSRCRRR